MDSQAMLAGFVATAKNFIPLLSGSAAALFGLWLVQSAVVKMVKMGDASNGERHTWGQIGGTMFIGALMLQFSSTMQDVSLLMFGSGIQDYHAALAYMPAPQSNPTYWNKVIEACLIWVVMLGWAAALRGFAQWSKAANGSGGGQEGDFFWKGVWHIFGGAACINIAGAIQSFLGK